MRWWTLPPLVEIHTICLQSVATAACCKIIQRLSTIIFSREPVKCFQCIIGIGAVLYKLLCLKTSIDHAVGLEGGLLIERCLAMRGGKPPVVAYGGGKDAIMELFSMSQSSTFNPR